MSHQQERDWVTVTESTDRLAVAMVPAAFLSISLSGVAVERLGATPDERALFSFGVQDILERFSHDTKWRPKYAKAVAGAIRYTKYNFLLRFIMKQIARSSGGSTDTTHDHEYTDRAALDQFIADFTTPMRFSPVKSVCTCEARRLFSRSMEPSAIRRTS